MTTFSRLDVYTEADSEKEMLKKPFQLLEVSTQMIGGMLFASKLMFLLLHMLTDSESLLFDEDWPYWHLIAVKKALYQTLIREGGWGCT